MTIATTSIFQQQFPLSPRKVWKKVIPKIFGLGILSLIGALMLLLIWGDQRSTAQMTFGLAVSAYLIFAGILFVLFLLPYVWYIRVYIRRYYYDANDHFLTIKKGVFTPTEIHVQYAKIQDVYVDQDILDRMMGLYDVHIASATVTSGIEAHIDGVGYEIAEGLKNFLLEKIRTSGTAAGQPSAGIVQSQNQPSASQLTIHLQEDVSSTTFPIEGIWILVGLFTNLKNLLILGALLSLLGVRIINGHLQAIVILVIVFYAANLLLQPIYLTLWKRNYRFAFTPEHIFVHEGVIAKQEKHIPYSTVQDVLVNQSILERLFGLASVTIQNAAGGAGLVGGGMTIPGQTLERANKLAEVVKSNVLSRNSTQTGL